MNEQETKEENPSIEEEEEMPLQQLLEDVESLKERVAALEAQLQAHGHTIDLNRVAELVYHNINAFLRDTRKKQEKVTHG